MESDTSGVGWQQRASAFDGVDAQRWALAFNGGDGRQLWQRWIIEISFNDGGDGGIRWRQQCLTTFYMASLMDYGKVIVRQRWPAQQDERAVQRDDEMSRG